MSRWLSDEHLETHKGSRYEQSGNFMDFDPCVDSDKIGNPEYPNAGMNSVLKHQFLDDLLNENPE